VNADGTSLIHLADGPGDDGLTTWSGDDAKIVFESDREEQIGGFRETPQRIDAHATTFGFDTNRSNNGFPSIEDAKAIVESFKAWELYGVHGATVESEVREESQST
jgi:hypothetical protein